MGDDEARPPPHQHRETPLDEGFALAVEVARRLVQDQNARVRQDRPRDGQALLLPAAEAHAPLADERAVALLRLADETVGVRGLRRGDDLIGARLAPGVGDVLGDGAVEEKDILLHDAQERAVTAHVDLAKVAPVEQDAPLRGVVEPGHEVAERGLAAAAGADQGDGLPRRDIERHTPDHGFRLRRRCAGIALALLSPRVREPDILQLHAATHALRGKHHPIRPAGELPLLGEEIEHAVERGEVALDLARGAGQGFQRPQQHQQVGAEHHQVAQRQVPIEHLRAAVDQHRRARRGDEHGPGHFQDPRPPPRQHLDAGHVVLAGGETLGLGVLPREAPHHPDPAERLGRARVDRLAGLLLVAVQRSDPRDPRAVRHPHQREERDGPAQHPPIDHRQDDQRADQLHDRPPRVVDHAEEQFARQPPVLPQQARHPTALVMLDPVQRQPPRVLESRAPQFNLDPLGDACELPPPHRAQHHAEERQPDHHPAQPPEHRVAVLRDEQEIPDPIRNPRRAGIVRQDVIQRYLRARRDRQPGDRHHRQRRQPQHHPGPVRLRESPELGEEPPERPRTLVLVALGVRFRRAAGGPRRIGLDRLAVGFVAGAAALPAGDHQAKGRGRGPCRSRRKGRVK